MTQPTQPPLIDKLKIFHKELIEYRKLENNRLSLTGEDHERRKSLRDKLLREAQIYKDKIIELTNFHHIEIKGKTYDIWVEAFDQNFFSATRAPSIDYCIDTTNIAIGKLESLELSKTGGYSNLGTPQETASYLFDAMQLHPKIVEASRGLFKDKHYSQAIFEAFKAVENFVKEKSGSTRYGKQLMATVFNEDNPIIKVSEAEHFDKDVQEGFKFLFMGAYQGIRNPKAHKKIVQTDPYLTLEYLGFASFLLKRITYWEAGTT